MCWAWSRQRRRRGRRQHDVLVVAQRGVAQLIWSLWSCCRVGEWVLGAFATILTDWAIWSMLRTMFFHLNALPVPLLRQVPKISLFWCLFLVCFLGCFFGAQRVPKGSPKGSKIDEKEVSKRYLKKGPRKVPKMMILRTPQCDSSVVNKNKIDYFRVLVLGPFWVSFWRCFGSPNGCQGRQKATSKKH